MLTIESYSVVYKSRLVLDGISLQVQNGEMLALIGPNGAGKTTLIRALSGVIPVQSGTARINGRPLHQASPRQRARLLAVVPQAGRLPPAFTVRETVLMGRTPHLNFLGQASLRDLAIVEESLQRVDALPLANRLIGELSGGEQQRVLLARALAQTAPVLLLDEPTAHLDLQYQVTLLELVHELAREGTLTVLIALHDLNLAARYGDRIALLADHKIQACGRPEDVLNEDLLSRTYRVPVQVVPHPYGPAPLILAGIGKRRKKSPQ